MNKMYLYGGGALVVVIGVFALLQAQPTRPAPAPVAQVAAALPSSSTTTTTTPTKTASASPEDIVPGLYPNPIKNTATTPGIKIASIMVENNTDAAGNAVSDHLQFTLQNLTDKTLSNPEVYYTIMDVANGKKEGYYKQLTGLTLAPHSTATVHFDGQSGAGHYPVNMHGIYGTTTDQLKFTVEVSIAGYAPVKTEIAKAPGGAEVVGQ